MSTSQKIVWAVSILLCLFLVVFVFRFIQMANSDLKDDMAPIATTTVYDLVELKSQKDFSLTGQPVLVGGGFEPGWNFKLNLAGNKFGLEIFSQYGEEKYVGYIDLVGQSTSTKLWGGLVLDKNNIKQTMGIKVDTKKCIEPSGDEVDYTVKVLIGTVQNVIEELDGCAKLAI